MSLYVEKKKIFKTNRPQSSLHTMRQIRKANKTHIYTFMHIIRDRTHGGGDIAGPLLYNFMPTTYIHTYTFTFENLCKKCGRIWCIFVYKIFTKKKIVFNKYEFYTPQWCTIVFASRTYRKLNYMYNVQHTHTHIHIKYSFNIYSLRLRLYAL